VKKIVVPIDFSDLSQELVDYAADIAKCFGARLYLLHITQVVQIAEMFADIELGMPPVTEPQVLLALTTGAQKQLDQYQDRARARGVEVDTAVLSGLHYMEIIQFAQQNQADLIIIGSHGHSGWQALFLGSVAEKVAHKSPIPILIYKRSPSPAEQTKSKER